jgi:hypothetical protein
VGSTSAVDIDKDGKSIWVAERCGANRCVNQQTGEVSPLDVVLKFDSTGKLVKSFGAGMFVFPHGIHVDRDGNIWVTDGADNFPTRGRGAAADAPLPPPPAKPIGHQIYKFSPDGKLLLTLGKAGGNRPESTRSVVVLSAERRHHEREGRHLRVRGPHAQRGPHAHQQVRSHRQVHQSLGQLRHRARPDGSAARVCVGFEGPVFVADRSNNRIQIFDQDGNLLDHGWEQYSRISGLWIDRNDVIYAADSESGSVEPARLNGSAAFASAHPRRQQGAIKFFIPIPTRKPPARARRRASPSTRMASFTALKSGPGRSKDTSQVNRRMLVRRHGRRISGFSFSGCVRLARGASYAGITPRFF